MSPCTLYCSERCVAASETMVATRRREVHTMEQAYTIRKTLLMTAAIATVAVPLLVSAAVKDDPKGHLKMSIF